MPPSTELVPPWEKFPTLEKDTIGWRMGFGESYRYQWGDFIDTLATDFDTRLSYLKRHQPAPINWCSNVTHVLYPNIDSSDEIYVCSEKEKKALLKLRLITADAAYKTWLKQQANIQWPWLTSSSPEDATRYYTRDFWFFSRQFNDARATSTIQPKDIPKAWQAITEPLITGQVNNINPSQGLLTMAQMLCAGKVKSPWDLDLPITDFTDSFEMDMNYSDAYQLWIISAFDDNKVLKNILKQSVIPTEWTGWVEEQTYFE